MAKTYTEQEVMKIFEYFEAYSCIKNDQWYLKLKEEFQLTGKIPIKSHINIEISDAEKLQETLTELIKLVYELVGEEIYNIASDEVYEKLSDIFYRYDMKATQKLNENFAKDIERAQKNDDFNE